MSTTVTPQLVDEARTYLKSRGMDPEIVDRIPRETLVFHLANGITFPSLYEVVEGRRRADQQEEPTPPGTGWGV